MTKLGNGAQSIANHSSGGWAKCDWSSFWQLKEEHVTSRFIARYIQYKEDPHHIVVRYMK